MKKLVIGLFMVSMLAVMASAGLLTDNKLLSAPLAKGKLEFDTKVSYTTATEGVMISSSTTAPEWTSLSNLYLQSLSYTEVPMSISYGLLDNVSLRMVVPFAQMDVKSTSGINSTASGLGNIQFNGVWQMMSESQNAPAVSSILGVKVGGGKKISELAANEAYVANRDTDILLAGVASKNFAPVTTKVLLGYQYTAPYAEDLGASSGGSNAFDVKLPDQVVYSLGLEFPVNKALKVSGELWGNTSTGKELITATGVSTEIPFSERSSLTFTPTVAFNILDTLSLNAAADLVLSKTAASTVNIFDCFKSNTYSFWGTYLL